MELWKKFFRDNRTISLPKLSTIKYGEAEGYCLSLRSLTGIPLASVLESILPDEPIVSLGLRISCFNEISRRFFGATWKSPMRDVPYNDTPIACNFEETIFYHSSLQDSSCFGVLEVVIKVLSKGVVRRDHIILF